MCPNNCGLDGYPSGNTFKKNSIIQQVLSRERQEINKYKYNTKLSLGTYFIRFAGCKQKLHDATHL